MKFNPLLKAIFVLLLTLGFSQASHSQQATFSKIDSLYPFAQQFENHKDLVWGTLSVPENWTHPDRKIDLAVCVLKNTGNIQNPPAVVYIEGGPGASGIQNINAWLGHPLRRTNDIVLFDVRGTGFSSPSLCPDLGKEILKILAKDQDRSLDEEQKVNVVMSCKDELLRKGIDVNAYNSLSVAQDLHALKTELAYDQWNVYGASYGTYMAQVYASTFPKDIRTLVLDSSIENIDTYFSENTSNYMEGLSKVFAACKNDAACNQDFPELEKVFYEVIEDLEKNPIKVTVGKELLESGEFTFNAEDFKISIQQALYNKQLIELIPLLIYQFHERNGGVLGNLVSAFSNLLRMDYGVYYCVNCNETLHNNSVTDFQQDAAQYAKLNGGLSFYKSDFKVCEAWNRGRVDSSLLDHNIANLAEATFPVLVFAGEYDPITPGRNGERLAKKFNKGSSVKAHSYGHVPGFTNPGAEIAEQFIRSPEEATRENLFADAPQTHLVTDIVINNGISKLGDTVSKMNPMLIAPLVLALLLMLIFIFTCIVKLVLRKYDGLHNKVLRSLVLLTSIIGLLTIGLLISALLSVAQQNFFILAFGLPENYSYVFSLVAAFLIGLLLTLIYYFVTIKKTEDRSIVFSIIFSNMLLAIYLFYWGVI